jgi:hypothetical protein
LFTLDLVYYCDRLAVLVLIDVVRIWFR